MTSRWLPITILVTVALGLVAIAPGTGCGDDEGAAEWVDAVHTLDAQAGEAREAGRGAEAEALLRRALEREVPAQVAPRDAAAVRRALLGQLAEVALDSGDWEGAARWASEGLALGAEADVLRANLLILRGEARERGGDARGAAADYHAAVEITDTLLRAILEDDVHVPLPAPVQP
jgi:hypothetical protein